jgi:hypothetical protein
MPAATTSSFLSMCELARNDMVSVSEQNHLGHETQKENPSHRGQDQTQPAVALFLFRRHGSL